MSCEVYGCRWSSHHTTKEHTCGQCHKKGHGQRGCPELNHGITLVKYTTMNSELVQQFLSSDKFLPVSDPNYLKRLMFTRLNPGEYSIHSIGMGHVVCIRNNSGRYDYFVLDDVELWGLCKHHKGTTDLLFTKNFLYGYRKPEQKYNPRIYSLL